MVKSVMAVALVVAAAALLTPALAGIQGLAGPPAPAAEPAVHSSPVLPDRTACLDIGTSDLRSPREGLWFQDNCLPEAEGPLAGTAPCNRSTFDTPEFDQVTSDLHVFRQSPSSFGYLWYAGAEACIDLVSARIVTAVCVDMTVSFRWVADPCAARGGVLTWVNGP
jgi:hypothetical protein